MRAALDTNVLAYAEGTNGQARKDAALQLIAAIPPTSVVLPAQTLAELFNVLVLKARRPPGSARAAVLSWRDAYVVIDTSSSVLVSALDLAADHQFRIWDAVILAAAAESACRLLLSEDLQDGFTWRGVTVTNPFAPARHPLLEALLISSEPDETRQGE